MEEHNVQQRRRKLPKPFRIANLVYQFVMIILTGVNTILVGVNASNIATIPAEYFEFFAVIATVIPVVWTNLLNECKTYVDEGTPQTQSPIPPATELETPPTQ